MSRPRRGSADALAGADPDAPLGAWPRAYAVVIAELVLTIALLLLLSRISA